jgi:hypothetical protein
MADDITMLPPLEHPAWAEVTPELLETTIDHALGQLALQLLASPDPEFRKAVGRDWHAIVQAVRAKYIKAAEAAHVAAEGDLARQRGQLQ